MASGRGLLSRRRASRKSHLSLGVSMSKNQNTFEKRRREMEKRQRAEEKREIRRKRKEEGDEPTDFEADATDEPGSAE